MHVNDQYPKPHYTGAPRPNAKTPGCQGGRVCMFEGARAPAGAFVTPCQ